MANTAVFGIYSTREDVESAVGQLKAQGFRATDISILFPQNIGSKDLAHERATKAPEGAAAGAGSGAVIGGALAWLASIGALSVPGVGPLLAAGPIVAALAGAGAGGAIGGVAGALIGYGIPEYEAKRYESRVKDGGVLLSVHCATSDEIARVKELLKRTGADDISTASEASSGSYPEQRDEPYATTSSDRKRL